MSKNRIIQVLIICTVFFSTLACILIYHYMAPSRRTIYIFNRAYKAGEQIRAEMLSPLQADSTIIMAGKKMDISGQFVTPSLYHSIIKSGDSLRMDVSEGMPLMSSMLSVAGGSSVEMLLKSDAIAITIPVDPFSGVTSELKEGAKVNIYANMDSQTKLIQQNKRILEVYKENGEITGVAVEENIQESLELVYAANYGKIYLGLVDGTGYQSTEGNDLVYSPYILKNEMDNTSEGTPKEKERAKSNEIPVDIENQKQEDDMLTDSREGEK